MGLMAYFPLEVRTQRGLFAGGGEGGGERGVMFGASVGKLVGREDRRVVDAD